jgi:hypothetical protein
MSGMALEGQTDALASLHFDDVRTLADPAPSYTDTATYRTFDGQVIELSGRREGEKALLRVTAHRDADLAAKFATPPAAPEPAASPEAAATPPAAAAEKPVEPGTHSVERIQARAQGVEFEIPIYKYEAIFKPIEDLLEPRQ